ncbi:MAG: hypothetical protein RBS78_09080, partial [Coriobacteriia bacterium]|nr:hypothetical protein [Coriobacteriia bacterium]
GSCDEEPFRDVFKESLGQFSAQDWQFMFAEHAEVEPASILHGSRPEQARRSHELVDVAPENRSPELGRDRVLMGAVSRFVSARSTHLVGADFAGTIRWHDEVIRIEVARPDL